ncbi:SPOR domain-containing protein [Persephonella sp.]
MKRRYLITALISVVTLASIEILTDYHINFATFTDYKEAEKYLKNLPPMFKENVDLIKLNNGQYAIKYNIFRDNKSSIPMPLGINIAAAQNEQRIFMAKEKYLYSLQLASFKIKENAERFLQKLPLDVREEAFIYKTNSGYYTVRYGLFDTYNLTKEVQKTFPLESVIVKSLISKVAFQREKEKKIKKDLEEKTDVVKKTDEELSPTKEKPSVPITAPIPATPSYGTQVETPDLQKVEEKVAKELEEKQPEEKPIQETKVVPVIEEETEEAEALDISEFEEEEELQLFEEEKVEIPLYKKIIGGLLFLPAYMWTHKQRGFWGKIEFTYKKESYKDSYRKTTRNSFKQYYELNYEGFIYSPRLVTYRLGGSFIKEDSQTKTGDFKGDTTSKLFGYDIDINLLKSTKFPINIFAKRSQSPLWYTYYDKTSYIERKTDSHGIFGSFNFQKSRISYSYKNTKADSVGIDFEEYRKTKEYMISYGKSDFNKSLNITYQKSTDDYIQRYLTINSYREVNQDIDSLKFDYNLRPSETSVLKAFARYYSNSYTDIKDYTGNVNFNWNPSEKLFSNISFSISRNESSYSDVTYFTFNENINYSINDNWNFNQTLLLFVSKGSDADVNLGNLGLSLSYGKNLSETFNIFAGTSVSGSVESNKINRYGGTFSLNAGLSKKFSFLDSQFFLSGSSSKYTSNKNDKSDTYTLNERWTSNLTRNLKFEHFTTYYYQDSKYYVEDNKYNKISYENVETSNSLKYYTRLGWKGTFNSGVGLKYFKGKRKKERFYPFGNINLNYKFTKRLLYRLSIEVYRDTYYNNNYGVARTGIDYRIRSLYFNWDFHYYYEDSDYYGKKKNYITYFKVYRPF